MADHKATSRAWDVVCDGAQPLPNEQQLPEEFHPRPRKWKFEIQGWVTDDQLQAMHGQETAAGLIKASWHPVLVSFTRLDG